MVSEKQENRLQAIEMSDLRTVVGARITDKRSEDIRQELKITSLKEKWKERNENGRDES